MQDLAMLRKNAGYVTQDAFSKAVGVDRSTVAKWETGARCPPTQKLPMLSKLLRCTEGDVISACKAMRQNDS